MAMTKAEAAKLTNDLLLRGVIETIVRESQLLQLLPFMEVTGTAVTYNREATMPAVSFYDAGDTWTEATPTFTQATANLKILGGDADVDNFLQATYADPNDLEAEVIASRAKAIAHKFSRGSEHNWPVVTLRWTDRDVIGDRGTAQQVGGSHCGVVVDLPVDRMR